MAEDTASADQAGTETLANGADTSPQAGLISQYVKDLSFENPNAPAVYQWSEPPRVDVQFNLGSQQLGDEFHELLMKIEVAALGDGDKTAFRVELTYGGLFGIRNVPAEQIQPFMLSEAPRLLFPFARRVLADAVRDGGFQPLLLDPIDFHALYQAQQTSVAGQEISFESAGQA